jgi:cytoskeletal protein CcmA (bactofilin family)
MMLLCDWPHQRGGTGVALEGRTEMNMDAREITVPASVSNIGADIVVTGNIQAKVDLHIEGRVDGDVRCATLILGEKGAILGSVYAERVRLSGTVTGAIETRDLAIEATGRVSGDVTYERLRVANGGVLEGKLTCKASGQRETSSPLKFVAGAGTQKPKAIHIE